MRIFLILLLCFPIISEAQPIFECPEFPTEPISSATYREWSVELEYSTSKRDITIAVYSIEAVDEKRYTLFVKYYVGTSFHVSLGPYFYDISFESEDDTSLSWVLQ